MLLQGDQSLAKPWDLVAFGFPFCCDVEVDDAKEKKKRECKKDEFGLQRESLEVFEVGDRLPAAKLSCVERKSESKMYGSHDQSPPCIVCNGN